MIEFADGQLLSGHVLDVLGSLPEASVHCVVTSPPYWGLRKYAGEQVTPWSDGLWAYGQEDTPERWADHTVEWLEEVNRVLRPDGVVWLNVGDSYHGSWGDYSGAKRPKNNGTSGYKPLDLIHTPSLLVPRLREYGWYVRSVIVWAKPNPMPESVSGTRWEKHRLKVKAGDVPRYGDIGESAKPRQDYENAEWANCLGCPKCDLNEGLVLRRGSWRPTESKEWILMLTKSNSYYCDMDAVREPAAWERWGKQTTKKRNPGTMSWVPDKSKEELEAKRAQGRNLRDVWTFPTQPFRGAHFATFPQELVRRCVKASTPEGGVCAECGAPWARVVESHQTLGWRATCRCTAGTGPAIVLDAFCGSGTTAVVARELGRRFIGIDLSDEYLQMASGRLS